MRVQQHLRQSTDHRMTDMRSPSCLTFSGFRAAHQEGGCLELPAENVCLAAPLFPEMNLCETNRAGAAAGLISIRVGFAFMSRIRRPSIRLRIRRTQVFVLSVVSGKPEVMMLSTGLCS